ncbi:MAG: DUF4249 family protein [Bacteroidales bacterium]|nr:DUF4249 family protein [Bacteroidales bacterium]
MRRVCIFLILVTALTSCVKDVVLDAKEDPFLAVFCVLKNESVQELKLSFTKSATMNAAPRVTEATAVLTDLTEGREAGRFVRVADTLWRLNYSAIPTHSYRLEITVPGREPVWAEQTMPAEPPVESEKHLFGDISYYNMRITDFMAEGFRYRFTVPCTTWIYAKNFDKDKFVGSWEPWDDVWVPAEELCTDYPYVDDFNLTGKILEGTEERSNTMLDAIADRYHLSGYPIHRDFLRIPKAEEQTQYPITIDGDFSLFSGGNNGHNYVCFVALSDDYDSYLLNAYQQYYAEQSDDLSSIYLRDNLYGNIHGGIGIFGSATTIQFQRIYSWNAVW